MLEYICTFKMYVTMYSKWKYIPKLVEMIFNLWKQWYLLKITIWYYWTIFVIHVKSLNNYHITNEFFKTSWVEVIIKNLINNHFQMEDDKKCEMCHLLKFHFKMFLGWLIQTKHYCNLKHGTTFIILCIP
jgi:hypothetical protein